MASLLAFVSRLNKNSSYSDNLQINDTEIFGVSVRIYTPVPEESEDALLPGLIYFHGGGWTIGSLGKEVKMGILCGTVNISFPPPPVMSFPFPVLWSCKGSD